MGFFGAWALKRKLGSSDRSERLRAVDEIRTLPEREALDLLDPALQDPDLEVRRAAARAVAAFASREALGRIERAVADRLFALATPPSEPPDRWASDPVEELATALEPFGAAAADLLIRILDHREAQTSAGRAEAGPAGAHRAAELLGRMRYAPAERALVARLRDAHASVRLCSAFALGELGARAAVPALVEAVGDRDESVRAKVAEALGKAGDRAAAAALEPLLEDRSSMVQHAAAAALEALGWTPSTPAQRARTGAVRNDLKGAATEGTTALRPLLSRLWGLYGIENHRTNDVDGVSRQLTNLMKKTETRWLPLREDVEEVVAAFVQALQSPGPDRPRIELRMVSSLPDLRVRCRGRVERENEHSGYSYEADIEYDQHLSCQALRQRASDLLA